MKKKARIHLMGIGGSGCSAAAYLARKSGFLVSGCDLNLDSAYLKLLKKLKVNLKVGHDIKHLRRADFLVVSPAALAANASQPEIQAARKQKKLLTWQEFVGFFLQKDKEVIAVAGTHGKTTTTALLALVLEKAGFDPTALIGGIVKEWGTNARFGQSRFFVCEADEFNNNFLHYSASVALINNIEMDHPEFFKDFNQLLKSFMAFAACLKEEKILIVNTDDAGVRKFLTKYQASLVSEGVRVIGYRLGVEFDYPYEFVLKGKIIQEEKFGTWFTVDFGTEAKIQEKFKLGLPGRHNVANALAVLATTRALGISLTKTKEVFKNFQGVKRRLDLIGEGRGVRVLDDYGHHPTQIRASLNGLKQRYPERGRIWAIFEPHQTRFRVFTKEFVAVLKEADRVIITPVFWAREKESPGLMPADLAELIGRKATYVEDFDKIASLVVNQAEEGDLVIVFGAGKSSQLANLILEKLKS